MITTAQLSQLLSSAIRTGTEQALGNSGLVCNLVTKKQAYAQFGRCDVDRWIKEKLLTPVPPMGKRLRQMIDKKQLLAVAGASNRISYLPVADR